MDHTDITPNSPPLAYLSIPLDTELVTLEKFISVIELWNEFPNPF
jgi:hypothetical protein